MGRTTWLRIMRRGGTPSARSVTASGWSAATGGLLLAIALLLIALIPPPDPAGVPAWVSANSAPLTWSDELLFFAIVLLTPGVAMTVSRNGGQRFAAYLGSAALAGAAIAFGGIIAIIGRLVYPVFEITLAAETTALLVSSLYGTLHTALLLLGIGMIAVAHAVLARAGQRSMAIACYCLGALQAVAAFPWLTPTPVKAVAAAGCAAWAALVAGPFAARPRP